MLSKDICQKCHRGHGFSWLVTDEDRWGCGQIWCFCTDEEVASFKEAEKLCPRWMEHLVTRVLKDAK